ncbi:hypothetical protein [Saccharothrix luteola]|uniref:hypothetical protein n=1 Tax=Saccharothrix luteola TaxID=2893018 RepID=UPI001E595918|nr:hypothetical protein [Saccharothrix luteola]MCC8251600.1 hypothetical protein [Saccharothrix luteola]
MDSVARAVVDGRGNSMRPAVGESGHVVSAPLQQIMEIARKRREADDLPKAPVGDVARAVVDGRGNSMRPAVGESGHVVSAPLQQIMEIARKRREAENPVDYQSNEDGSGEERSRVGVERPFERTYELSPHTAPEAYLRAVAKSYRINLRGGGQDIAVMFDPMVKPGAYGRTLEAEEGKVIRVGPYALSGGDAAVANTIAHELKHARYLIRNGDFTGESHGDTNSVADGTPYGSGNALEQWIKGLR